ncbi:hypothetical protein [Poritiphilus flavus]|uniref:ABM domain-containing protein n=1 Tax=Poritiphilus flavus TaxID=2697053 RepID=A0A6L9EFU6_9FLAO|nr:hypothetical protein [Poritiphilus flavus]NAS13586.1 hypothetical protein [Poritiphilus flavus]
MKKSIVLFAIFMLTLNCGPKTDGMKPLPKDAVVRISLGYYPSEKEGLVEEKLQTVFKDKIMPAVKRLNGNISYYVGMDKQTKSITNVSIWENREDALQMKSMKEMAEMAKDFREIGVEFKEITNHEMIWQLPE